MIVKIIAINQAVRASLDYGFANPDECLDYIRSNSQELEPDIVRSHIELYVNEFSKDLGTEGREAVEAFLEKGRQLGTIPQNTLELML